MQVNKIRWLLAAVVVFVVMLALDWLTHNVLLSAEYERTAHLWRSAAEVKTGLMLIVQAVTAFLLVYIFAKGYEGRGWLEGVRFGVIIGLFMTIPRAYGTYAVMPIPYSLALGWFLYGMVTFVLLGLVAAALYRPASRTSAGGA